MKKMSLFFLILTGTLLTQNMVHAHGRRGAPPLDAVTRARVQVIKAEARVIEAKMTRTIEIHNGKVDYSFYGSTDSLVRISVSGNKVTELFDYLQKEYGQNNVILESGLFSTTIAISNKALELRSARDSIDLFSQVDTKIKGFYKP